MKKLYSSNNVVELHLLKAKLEASEIQAFIKNEYPPAAGELPSIVAPPELWILDDDEYDKANSVIQSASVVSGPAWHCPNCGEHISGEFDLCWKCGNPRKSSSS